MFIWLCFLPWSLLGGPPNSWKRPWGQVKTVWHHWDWHQGPWTHSIHYWTCFSSVLLQWARCKHINIPTEGGGGLLVLLTSATASPQSACGSLSNCEKLSGELEAAVLIQKYLQCAAAPPPNGRGRIDRFIHSLGRASSHQIGLTYSCWHHEGARSTEGSPPRRI